MQQLTNLAPFFRQMCHFCSNVYAMCGKAMVTMTSVLDQIPYLNLELHIDKFD